MINYIFIIKKTSYIHGSHSQRYCGMGVFILAHPSEPSLQRTKILFTLRDLEHVAGDVN